MHSKVLVVDLGEIARAGQDHCSALQPISKVRQFPGFVYGYTLSHSRLQHISLALHLELDSDSRNRLVHSQSPTLLPCQMKQVLLALADGYLALSP